MKANVQGPLADLHAWRIFMANPHKQSHPMRVQSRPQLGVHQLETTSAAIDSAADDDDRARRLTPRTPKVSKPPRGVESPPSMVDVTTSCTFSTKYSMSHHRL